MLGGDGQGVEENQEDDQPVEDLRLDPCPALPPEQPVPPARVPAGRGRRKEREERRKERVELSAISCRFGDFVLCADGQRLSESRG